jgi:hypothetical protein
MRRLSDIVRAGEVCPVMLDEYFGYMGATRDASSDALTTPLFASGPRFFSLTCLCLVL